MDKISKFSIFNPPTHKVGEETKKGDASKNTEDVPQTSVNADPQDPKKVMDALNMAGVANKAHLGAGIINPRDYLSEERIQDIQKSMGVFDDGVKEHAAALDKEFGNNSEYQALSESDRLELAAKSFALE